MSETVVLSRRAFLVGTSAAGIVVSFGALPDIAQAGLTLENGAPVNAWVAIDGDGIVTIQSAASEMGQGVMTTLPAIIAEELDADWAKVKVVQSPSDEKTYGNPHWGGSLTTVGSRSVFGYWDKLRLAGAQARKIFIATAAEHWQVPAAELTTEPHAVVHAKSGRRIGYGELAKDATLPLQLPEATKADFKAPSQYRILGHDLPRVDVPSKVDGSAVFGMDIRFPDMLYAMVLHPPVQGEKAEKIDDAAAKAVKGVVAVVPMPMGVGVIAETFDAARRARLKLKVTWSETAKARSYTSDKVAEDYRKIAGDWSQAGVAMVKEGDAAAALAGAAKVVAADYHADHVSHVCMEPMNATARVTGDKVEIWASNQSPTALKNANARVAGTTPDKVVVNTPFLGGGFGRRSDPDVSIEAVMLAKAVPGRPVKVTWTREDDIARDKFRPLAAQRVEVGLDAAGNILGWRHRIVAESFQARTSPPLFEKTGGKDGVSAGGGDFNYAVPAHLVDYVRQQRGVDVGAWRGIAPGYVSFAIETMIDELAALKGVDPVAYRLSLLKSEPRARHIVETVAEMAEWGRKREGRGLGIAYSNDLGSHTAIAAEVSLDQKTGEIKVEKVWAAVDPGLALQPRHIVAQMESAMLFGIGAALSEQITIEGGEVQQQNFGDYQVLRMSDIPEFQIQVVSTDNHPTGIGEAGVPPMAPAIANAVAQLTAGKRLRQLPMLPERVLAALKV